jgi:hypothetical protein
LDEAARIHALESAWLALRTGGREVVLLDRAPAASTQARKK